MTCPECGTLCERDEVDVGPGVICGPWSCLGCGWSESRFELPPPEFAERLDAFDGYGDYDKEAK